MSNHMLMLLAETNNWTGYVFIVVLLVGSVLLTYGVYQVVVDSRTGERKRIVDRMKGVAGGAAKSKEPSTIAILRDTAAELDAASGLQALIGKLSFIPRLQVTIDQANLPWSAARTVLHLFAAGSIALAGLLLIKSSLLTSLACSAAVFFLPLMWISMRRKRRMNKLTQQLPDVFSMMSQALRAGHSLASAIQLIHEQLPDPIGTEFGRVFHEQNLGIKIEDALLAMADRVDQLDVRFFVTAVLIQRQTGGDLAEVLENISSVIRQRIELFGLVKGLTAEGRLSGWVLFALPFIVFLAVNLLNPDYAAQLFTDPRGKILLAVAIGMQLMGLAMIRWIVNIKV